MSATIELESGSLYVCRINGVLQRADFVAGQQHVAREIDAGIEPRLLAIFEEFEGWERGVDWSDVDFLISRGNKIARIAMLGEPRWEAEAPERAFAARPSGSSCLTNRPRHACGSMNDGVNVPSSRVQYESNIVFHRSPLPDDGGVSDNVRMRSVLDSHVGAKICSPHLTVARPRCAPRTRCAFYDRCSAN